MIDAIRARHVPCKKHYSEDEHCAWDDTPWPCDTATVLAALDRERDVSLDLGVKWQAAEAREAALRAALNGHHENGICSVASPEAET